MSYPRDNRQNQEKYKQYFEHEDRFVNFYLDLFKSIQVYSHIYPEYGPSAIIEFDSIEEYKSHVLLSVRQQLFLKIIIPDLLVIIQGSFDLTHVLYMPKGKCSVIPLEISE